MTSVTNHEFASAVGVHFTMASRLRSGARMPSAKLLARICQVYNLNEAQALEAYRGGKAEFSRWLRENVFEGEDDDAETAASA